MAELAGIDGVAAENLIGAVRLAGAPADAPGALIHGTLHDVVVYRYEWKMAGQQTPPPQLLQTPLHAVNRTLLTASVVRVDGIILGPDSVVGVGVQRFDGTVKSAHFGLRAVAENPCILGTSPSCQRYDRYSRSEQGNWFEDGNYVVGVPPASSGEARGAVHLYWSQSTLRLKNGSEEMRLESRIWEERPAGPAGPYVRHYVWHVLRARDSAVSLGWPGPTENVSVRWFARALTFATVDALSLDYVEKVKGELPHGSRVKGAALWMNGSMQVSLASSAADGRGPSDSFRLHANGTVLAYSVGGGAPFGFADPDVVTVGFLAALLVLLLLFKDWLGDFVARSWLVLYSKLSGRQILDHRLRDLIFRAVQSNPGIGFTSLRDLTRHDGQRPVAEGTLRHHLRHLQRFGLITSRRVGRRLLWFVTEKNGGGKAAYAAILGTPSARIVVKKLLDDPGRSQKQLLAAIAGSVGLTMQGLSYLLKRLESEGLVASRVDAKDRRRRLYGPTSLLKQALESR